MTMDALPPVNFEHYYRHAELSDHLRQVAAAEPGRVRLHNLHTTVEGREEWLVEVELPPRPPTRPPTSSTQPPRAGGLRHHRRPRAPRPTPHREDLHPLLSAVTFYIIPRVNPDGAEYALSTGGNIRSKFVPRPRKNGLHAQDLNGDGRICRCAGRIPTALPAGRGGPRLLVARKPGDEGPFYQMAQEGMIEDYDGGPIADAQRGFDFNRNWGYNWQPEHVQWGAGDYPFSNPR